MKHLLKIITNDISYEPERDYKINNSNQTVFLCYEINGYWFRLSRTQWAKYRKIGYGTLCGRQKSGKTNAEILGFKKIERVSNLPDEK